MNIASPPKGGTEIIRAASKALFGSSYRLEVAGAIAELESEIFYAKEIADLLGIASNLVLLELKHFENAGLIQRLDTVLGQRMQFYQRGTSVYWSLCSEFLRELIESQ